MSGKSLWLTVAKCSSLSLSPTGSLSSCCSSFPDGCSLPLKLPLEQTWHPRLGQHSQNTASVPKQEVMTSPHGTVSSCFQGWTFLHVWVSQVPWPGRPLSSLPLLVNVQLFPPRSALPSALQQPLCAQYLHTQPLSRLHPGQGSFLR